MQNNSSLGETIARLRKQHGMTQEQLAAKLNITFQAVSKWENGISQPDITMLPALAKIFDVTTDELFGIRAEQQPTRASGDADKAAAQTSAADAAKEDKRGRPQSMFTFSFFKKEKTPKEDTLQYDERLVEGLPWENDGTLRAVLFVGHTLIGNSNVNGAARARQNISFQYEGKALNIESEFDVICDCVAGNVTADGDVNCGDIGGYLMADGDVNCGNVGGDVKAGGDMNCGDVYGNASAGGDVSCGDVSGNVSAGDDVNCGDVDGRVTAGGDITCGTISGSVNCKE